MFNVLFFLNAPKLYYLNGSKVQIRLKNVDILHISCVVFKWATHLLGDIALYFIYEEISRFSLLL